MRLALRAAVYAAIFVALVLVFLPARLLSWAGVMRPEEFGVAQAGGLLITCLGTMLAAWSVVAFALRGRGTPAPFDPPRKLVTGGPYRFVRNPMYVGAGLTLGGASLFYGSLLLLGYAVLLLAISHLFIVFYEEPALRAGFGEEYERYCRRVRRWLPGKGISREAL